MTSVSLSLSNLAVNIDCSLLHAVCGCSLCYKSVQVDFILSHVQSTQKFVACPVLSSPFVLLSSDPLFEPDICLDCSALCLSVVSFLGVLKR